MAEPFHSQTGAHNRPMESLIVDTGLYLDILKISDAEELFALVEENRLYPVSYTHLRAHETS